MINQAHLTAEKMVGYHHFGTVPLRASGMALLIAFHRSANASPLAFLALPPDEARELAADILRTVIALENNLLPEDRVALSPFSECVQWHPFGEAPDTDRLVLITNEGWPEVAKTSLGWFEDGMWYEQSGGWLDGDPDSGTGDMPPTHWAEVPRRQTATGGSDR